MASKVLAQVSRQIGNDWQVHHGYRPVLLETFVDPKRFKGTSYRAANWQAIGKTDRSAKGADKAGTASKECYVYPLDKHFRAMLKNEKPIKPPKKSLPAKAAVKAKPLASDDPFIQL